MIDVRVFFKLKLMQVEQENLKMILSPEQAKEVGEALVDASERSVEDNKDHYVVYLDEADKAVCMAVDPEVHSYGYNIIAHITSP
jgi:hypothetical protein